RIGLTRPAQRGLGLFPRLQQRLIGPLRRDRRIRVALVEVLDGVERHAGGLANRPIDGAQNLSACGIRHKPKSLSFKEWCWWPQLPYTVLLGIEPLAGRPSSRLAPKARNSNLSCVKDSTTPNGYVTKSLSTYSLTRYPGGCQPQSLNGRKQRSN